MCCKGTWRALGLFSSLPALVLGAHALYASELVRFHFERPGVEVPVYTVALNADGTGTYSEETGSMKAPESAAEGETAARSSTIHVSTAVLDKLLKAKGSVGEKGCETRLKHIANTGRKTVTYSDKGTPLTCTFNFSDAPALNEVAATFIALAETLQAGERLAAKHRFDRLGLDPEMQSLVEEVRAGRAIEVGNIGPVLRSIADDDRVIDRVRRSAARLLQDSGPALSAPSSVSVPDDASPR